MWHGASFQLGIILEMPVKRYYIAKETCEKEFYIQLVRSSQLLVVYEKELSHELSML